MFYWPIYLNTLWVAACIGIGIYLLLASWRWQIQFLTARCAKCGYDIRAAMYLDHPDARCSECGAELAKERAVIYGQRRTSLPLAAIGLILLVTPAAVTWIQTASNPKPRFTAVGSIAVPPRLVTPRPDRRAESQEYWAAIDAALEKGTLTSAQVDSAVQAFVASLRQPDSAVPEARKQFAERSIANAFEKGIVSPETIKTFLSAIFNGDGSISAKVEVRPAVNVQPKDTFSHHGLRISCHPYTFGGGYLFKHVYCLREIRDAAGLQVGFRSSYSNGITAAQTADLVSAAAQQDFMLNHWLTSGTYELEFIFDVGAVPAEAVPRGLEGYWGAARKWPAPGKLWEYRHRCTIVIPEN